MDFSIDHRGVSYTLNPVLASVRGLDEERVETLRRLHREVIDLRHEATGTSDPAELRRIASEIEVREFSMQEAWGFDRTASHHTHWLTLPGCTCPARANAGLRGHPVRVVAETCPAHAGQVRDDLRVVATDRPDRPRTLADDPTRFA